MEKFIAFLVFVGLCYFGYRLIKKAKDGDAGYPKDDDGPPKHEDK